MTDDLTRVAIVDGPLAGYHLEVPVVHGAVPLRFNSLQRTGFMQHVYHLSGRDVWSSEPLFEYVGDDESSIGALPDPGIDVPAHAFVDERH